MLERLNKKAKVVGVQEGCIGVGTAAGKLSKVNRREPGPQAVEITASTAFLRPLKAEYLMAASLLFMRPKGQHQN